MAGLTVSVPIGHDATLQITDDGRTQTLDLRSGLHGAGEIPGYRPNAVVAKAAAYHSVGHARYRGVHLTVDVSVALHQLSGSLQLT